MELKEKLFFLESPRWFLVVKRWRSAHEDNTIRWFILVMILGCGFDGKVVTGVDIRLRELAELEGVLFGEQSVFKHESGCWNDSYR